MDKGYYETALLLAAGAVLGQIISILLEISFSIWSFVPMSIVIIFLGSVSLRNIAKNESLVTAGVRTRVATGVWIYLVWELFRIRVIWLVDILKFALLVVVLFFLYKIVHKRWEEDHA